MSTAFLLTTLVIVATPGTGVLYTRSAGLSRDARNHAPTRPSPAPGVGR